MSAFADVRERAPSLMAFVAHYPRRDLPGRCIGIVTVFHDLPEPYLAETQDRMAEWFAPNPDGSMRASGMLFEIRQTWQLDGDEPRLIEATVELTDGFERIARRDVPPGFFADPEVERITCDFTRGGHFQMFGGGARRGLLWVDRSYGLGAPHPWSAAYRMRPQRSFTTELAPEVISALREFVSRF